MTEQEGAGARYAAVGRMSSRELGLAVEQILGMRSVSPPYERESAAPWPAPPPPLEEPVLLTVRVDVEDVSPPVWRRLELRSDLRLDRVHAILQAAFGWSDQHVHVFHLDRRPDIRSMPILSAEEIEAGEEGEFEEDLRLDQVLRRRGARLFYTYDMADTWRHVLKVESMTPLTGPPAEVPEARCTGGRRACPLENAGGPWGHNHLVDALREDPSGLTLHPERREWLPPGYDPAAFSVAESDKAVVWVTSAPCPSGIPRALFPLLMGDDDWLERQVTDLCTRVMALPSASTRVTAEIAEPYRLLCHLSSGKGIRLDAGRLPARIVTMLRTLLTLGTAPDQQDGEHRPDPLTLLMDDAERLGLVSAHRGRLLRTDLGQHINGPAAYLQILGEGWLDPRAEGEVWCAAGALYALMVADAGSLEVDDALLATMLTRGGARQDDGDPLTPRTARAMTATTRRLLERAALVPGGAWPAEPRDPGDVRARVVALARALVFTLPVPV